jgi:hypothetical protein
MEAKAEGFSHGYMMHPDYPTSFASLGGP